MTTQEVANRLVELCREGKMDETQAELYAEHAVSIEANEMMGPKVTEGLEGIREKAKMFQSEMEEFHESSISEPIVAGNYFAIAWSLDATMKERGRMTMQEVCVYKVVDGKIVSEQFFN